MAFGVFALVAIAWMWLSKNTEPEPVVTEVVPTAPRVEKKRPESEVQSLKVKVHKQYPHDPKAFTQGLLWKDGKLFESTGLNGKSTLREVSLNSGVVDRKVDIDAKYFAEGLAWVPTESHYVQLTWLKGKALVWNESFEKVKELEYKGQGWGLCFDGSHLVMSDGSATLTFRDPTTFEKVRSVQVSADGRSQRNLNELECVKTGDKSFVYANVWQRDRIVKIDPTTGKILAKIDAKGLLSSVERRGTDVLNGIAYNPDTKRFYVTGKLWPKVFEVSFE